MNITITTFTNPFSFFCTSEAETSVQNVELFDGAEAEHYKPHGFNEASKVFHGQYVAVIWKGKWVRGIVSMESQFLIWLVDYGIFLRADDKTVCIDLRPEQKTIPTKIFEASVHGVMPIEKEITDQCELLNTISTKWNPGANLRAQELINSAKHTYFVPIGILSMKINDVVLGDLYLEIPEIGVVNLIDELNVWPVFLEKNKEAYIKNLPQCYTGRRRHRACTLKPNIPDLPSISPAITFDEYNAICEQTPKFEVVQEQLDNDGGSTVLAQKPKALTAEEVEQYAHMNFELNGREYNMLNTLRNKLLDMNDCARYCDHDLKSMGRGYSRHRF
ncbi:uncharacterized protein LOC105385288 [Plutella xylostella]|uniref:uncharacterized protein LOC105385288 n=1 Tax=Plutella xylostella TaxID=51655 RepID=UPI00203250B1|nr:uncharacterized protein LOC105385288 [Plutella xylostella]